MLVTVIVCTRNRTALLARCLESLRRQSVENIEIIVVDNDPTIENAEQVAAQFGARYVVEPHRGLSRARNAGAALARGEILAFTDDDVVADASWIEALKRPFDDPRVAAVAGRVSLADGADAVWSFPRGEEILITRHDPDWFELANFGGVGNGANMAFRRSVFPRFDVRLGLGAIIAGCEEHFAFFQLLEAGHAIAATPDAIVVHPLPPREGRRSLGAKIAAANYTLFIFLTQPRYRTRVMRYFLGALVRRRRRWRVN
jgi:glycosyltransferase involved in cell wall biosynthesis